MVPPISTKKKQISYLTFCAKIPFEGDQPYKVLPKTHKLGPGGGGTIFFSMSMHHGDGF